MRRIKITMTIDMTEEEYQDVKPEIDSGEIEKHFTEDAANGYQASSCKIEVVDEAFKTQEHEQTK